MPAPTSDAVSQAPLILACDTTQGACSAALYQDGLLADRLQTMRQGHAEILLGMVADMMQACGLEMAQIDRLAVTNGPGTFTGVRVGIAAMRGLALALGRPVKTYGTLEVMAAAARSDTPLLVAVDARRETFYVQLFDGNKTPLCPPAAVTANEAVALVGDLVPEAAEGPPRIGVMGSGASLLVDKAQRFFVCAAPDYPNAAHLAEMAARDTAWEGLPPAEPLYLRPPDASLPDRSKYPARQDR